MVAQPLFPSISAEIFAGLKGQWDFQRTVTGQGKALGVAYFKEKNHKHLLIMRREFSLRVMGGS